MHWLVNVLVYLWKIDEKSDGNRMEKNLQFFFVHRIGFITRQAELLNALFSLFVVLRHYLRVKRLLGSFIQVGWSMHYADPKSILKFDLFCVHIEQISCWCVSVHTRSNECYCAFCAWVRSRDLACMTSMGDFFFFSSVHNSFPKYLLHTLYRICAWLKEKYISSSLFFFGTSILDSRLLWMIFLSVFFVLFQCVLVRVWINAVYHELNFDGIRTNERKERKTRGFK